MSVVITKQLANRNFLGNICLGMLCFVFGCENSIEGEDSDSVSDEDTAYLTNDKEKDNSDTNQHTDVSNNDNNAGSELIGADVQVLCELKFDKESESSDTANIIVTMKNVGLNAIKLVANGTIFEGDYTKYFSIMSENAEVDYLGMYASLSNNEINFVELDSGESVDRFYNVATLLSKIAHNRPDRSCGC